MNSKNNKETFTRKIISAEKRKRKNIFNNIFMGNIGDGNATTTYMQASNNLFVGGNSDGWSSTSLLQSTDNIFAGGNSDGWSETSLMQAGNSIYMGGLGDGWSEIYYKPMVAKDESIMKAFIKLSIKHLL